mmetsp:Transcript_53873/g.136788  ORF Transcript_53873/g.136788 Transcript_53873/m.136788 type:complete len:295 (+) Transcript_53873:1482-2366(+)
MATLKVPHDDVDIFLRSRLTLLECTERLHPTLDLLQQVGGHLSDFRNVVGDKGLPHDLCVTLLRHRQERLHGRPPDHLVFICVGGASCQRAHYPQVAGKRHLRELLNRIRLGVPLFGTLHQAEQCKDYLLVAHLCHRSHRVHDDPPYKGVLVGPQEREQLPDRPLLSGLGHARERPDRHVFDQVVVVLKASEDRLHHSRIAFRGARSKPDDGLLGSGPGHVLGLDLAHRLPQPRPRQDPLDPQEGLRVVAWADDLCQDLHRRHRGVSLPAAHAGKDGVHHSRRGLLEVLQLVQG